MQKSQTHAAFSKSRTPTTLAGLAAAAAILISHAPSAQACLMYRRPIQKGPSLENKGSALLVRARQHLRKGRRAKAIAAFRSVALNKKFSKTQRGEAYQGLYQAYAKTAPKRALRAVRMAAKLLPNNSLIKLELARASLQVNKKQTTEPAAKNIGAIASATPREMKH